jgi:hypothetical protein
VETVQKSFCLHRLVWGVDVLGRETATGHPHVNEAVGSQIV